MELIEPIKRVRLPQEIANRIRALIESGAFRAGDPLPSERTLASSFHVSRGTIRDAFRTLETIGLLETRHGQGTFPRELNVDTLVTPLTSVLTYNSRLQDELLDVRRMFEPAVARVSASRITAPELDELDAIVATQRARVKARESTIAQDTAFHAAIARASHNAVIVHIMQTLNDLLVESRTQTLQQRGRPERSMRGHAAVVDALRRGDADGAAAAMTRHIQEIGELMAQSAGRSANESRGGTASRG
jgi:GntR family transcriptional repressor for pyruvate dehydrogenase complex